MKKVWKRFFALMMAIVMATSFSLNAAAAESQVERPEELLVAQEVLTTGEEVEVTSIFNEDGSVTLKYKEDGEVIREYNVFPGSGEYLQKEYTAEGVEQTRVITSESAMQRSAMQRSQELEYEEWGYMSYYNPYMSETYTIYCEIAEVVNPQGSFNVLAYYIDRAAFIASVISFFIGTPKALAAIAAKLFTTAKEKQLISVVASGAILALREFSVDAVVTDYWIRGVSTDDPDKKGAFDGGYEAVLLSDEPLFGRVEYSGIWTRSDWRNITFGRLMFWEVYGVEYTPTSWTP